MSAIAQELNTIDLGDERLNRRGRSLLSRFADAPQASIPVACRGDQEVDAAYKFFNNSKVDAPGILAPHFEATMARCEEEPVVLVVQDTTELDYTYGGLEIEGLGWLDHRGRRGMHLHLNAAFTPEGVCLGVVKTDFLTRSEESLGKAREREHWPIHRKESFRWLQGYRHACAMQGELIASKVVSVADAEADIYEVFLERERIAPDRPWNRADFLIRAKADRDLPQKAEDAGPWCHKKLTATLREGAERFRRTIDLPATPKREARRATLAARAARVTLRPPYRREKLPPVTVNAVLVEEIDPPEDVEPVEWLLVTSLPVESREEIERVVDYYRGRWPIETFFRTLKTGCGVEQLRLESVERLKPCIALYLIVTWRVQFTTMLGRECPNVSCDVLFSDAEWRSVWQIVRQEPPPSSPPKLGEFLPALASLGGYLGRRHDPPPGPKALWIGMRRMSDFAHAWLTFGPGHASRPT
jgi:hypothetical protein